MRHRGSLLPPDLFLLSHLITVSPSTWQSLSFLLSFRGQCLLVKHSQLFFYGEEQSVNDSQRSAFQQRPSGSVLEKPNIVAPTSSTKVFQLRKFQEWYPVIYPASSLPLRDNQYSYENNMFYLHDMHLAPEFEEKQTLIVQTFSPQLHKSSLTHDDIFPVTWRTLFLPIAIDLFSFK